ncbi:MAG: YcnI family copper-binding membrane protein [Aliihoeflea sp.]|uniref:YcnI family copper-binding membrane protein n=1 Tax=Aliihoeflea sp. TaxID=2608088 RepID=UPI0040347DD1
MFKHIITAAGLLALGTSAALAHVSLEGKEAAIGSTYKAVFRVPHGCEGEPTNVVRVRIPEGVIAVKPMPKPGWELEKVRGDYGTTYEYHGSQVSEGVTEIVWSGGNLADDEYDEFVLRGYLTPALTAGETLYFAVVQECPGGLAERWIEVPAEGQSADDLEMPAPGVAITEAAGGH